MQQVNACRTCIELMVRAGEWEIHGARVRQRIDLVLQAPHGSPLLLVDVTPIPAVTNDVDSWAERVHRNLATHGALLSEVAFTLAALPRGFYYWSAERVGDPAATFEYMYEPDHFTKRYFAQLLELSTEGEIERAVALWLSSVLWSDAAPWLKDERLQRYAHSHDTLRWRFQTH
jgi:hypothetical protein